MKISPRGHSRIAAAAPSAGGTGLWPVAPRVSRGAGQEKTERRRLLETVFASAATRTSGAPTPIATGGTGVPPVGFGVPPVGFGVSPKPSCAIGGPNTQRPHFGGTGGFSGIEPLLARADFGGTPVPPTERSQREVLRWLHNYLNHNCSASGDAWNWINDFPAAHALARRALAFVEACILFLLLTGCKVSESPADLVLISGPDPQSLDPALATGIEDLRVVTGLFEGLTRYDPVTSRPIPGLADHWEISTDGRIYTFHLRDNLLWSPGHPITADDIVFSWRRVLDPQLASEYAGQLYYLKNGQAYNEGKITDPSQIGVRALDAKTLRVELNDPTAFFLELCAFQTLAAEPRFLIEKRGEDWMRERPLPTSGAYRLEFWQLNYKIRLVKNPFYWDAANTKSQTIDCLSVTTPNTALNLYQTGLADVIWDQDLVPNELLDALKNRADYHTFHYLGSYFLRFNVTKPPFNNVRVRKALGLVIDKQRLVTKILHGGGVLADHLVPDGTANYEPTVGIGSDPEQGRRLLAEAGFPGGKGFPSFEYLFDAASGVGNIHAQIGVELQQMWRDQLGIAVQLKPMEKKVYLASQNHLDYDVSRSTWIGDYNDPNTFLDLFRSDNGNNRTGWKNARYDGLMHEANQQTDLKKRAAFLQEAETILVRDELPIVPLYFYVGFNYYDPATVHGIYPNILDDHPFNAIWKTPKSNARTPGKSRNFDSVEPSNKIKPLILGALRLLFHMPSFDIVSEVNSMEIENAVNQAKKELANRFDFKGSKAEITLEKNEIKLSAEDQFKITSLHEIVIGKLAKRQISLKSVESLPPDISPLGHARQVIKIKQGLEQPVAKQIAGFVRDTKLKVTTQIQGDAVRVTGKNRDDLQAVIAAVRGQDFPAALGFQNFRD